MIPTQRWWKIGSKVFLHFLRYDATTAVYKVQTFGPLFWPKARVIEGSHDKNRSREPNYVCIEEIHKVEGCSHSHKFERNIWDLLRWAHSSRWWCQKWRSKRILKNCRIELFCRIYLREKRPIYIGNGYTKECNYPFISFHSCLQQLSEASI